MHPRVSPFLGSFALLFIPGLIGAARAQTVGPDVVVRDPALANDVDGEYAVFEPGATYVVWRDERNLAATGGDIYAQKLGPDGAPLWGANGLAICTETGDQLWPSVVPDGAGGAVFVWLDRRDGSDDLIVAQRVSAAGVVQWLANGIPVGVVAFEAPRPLIHRSGDGGFLVTWWDSTPFVGPDEKHPLLAQKLDGNGMMQWDTAPPDAADPWGPGIEALQDITRGRSVPDGAGGLIVMGKIRGGGFRFQRLLPNQTLGWPTAVDFTATLGDGIQFNYAPDGAGGMLVAYREGSTATIRAFRVAVDGTLPWGAGGVDVVTSNNVGTQPPVVTADGAGGAFISWIANSPHDVRVQRFSANGVPQWAAAGTIVPDGSGTESDTALVSDGAGGLLLSFRTSTSLRGQRLDGSGVAQWSAGGSNGLNLGSGDVPIIGAGSNGPVVVYRDAFDRLGARKIVTGTTPLESRLINLSTRAFVGTGANLAIPGFVISGSGPKRLLIRAVGPTLGAEPFNVPGVVADPVLTIYNAAQQPIHTRDNWGEAGDGALIADTSAQLFAFALPAGSKDAAIVVDLAPGLYTTAITGVGNSTGVGIIEVYDGDAAASTSRLINLSSRVFVGTGAEVAIPGFVISGNTPVTLLVRAVGPTLGGAPFNVPGVLADPILTLYNSQSVPLIANDNWSDGGASATQAISDAAQQVFAFGLANGSADAALLVTLEPGLYTAGVAGVAAGTGVCLVEAYVVPQ